MSDDPKDDVAALPAPPTQSQEQQPTAPAAMPAGRTTRSKARAAQYASSPGMGSSEYDSSLTSALLSLSTAFVSGSAGSGSGGIGAGGPSRPNYSEGSLDPEDDEQESMEGDDEPMDCVKRDPSRVACVYRGDAPLTVKDFRNPAGGLFVRCRWCRARTTASSRATKARKEGLKPEFPLNHVPDPSVIPPTIGGMSTAGWEPVCSIKGCKAPHQLTINDFLNSYGDRLYRMCTTCRNDAARSRDRNKKRKSGQFDELSDVGGEKLDVATTPVPLCSGKGCAATRDLVLQDFLNPYGDALLKMCSFCRARHSSYKKAKKAGIVNGSAGGERGREEEAAEVLSHLASGSGSDGSEKGKKKKKAKPKAKSAAKVEDSSPSVTVDAFTAAFPHSFDLQALNASHNAALAANGTALPLAAAALDPSLPPGAIASANGFTDYTQMDFSNIDPTLLPSDPMDVLAAHGGPPSTGFPTYDYPVPVPVAVAGVDLPVENVADTVPVCATQSCKAKRPLTIQDFLSSDGKRLLATCFPCRAYNVNRPSNLKKRQQKEAASEAASEQSA